MDRNPTHLCWFDLETTGLDPTKDHVLEVCAKIARFDSPFDVIDGYTGVLRCRDMSKVDPYVLAMHVDSGLWNACLLTDRDAVSTDAKLAELVPALCTGQNKLVLAGFSVHFDLAFARVHFPLFAISLSHRVYDISSVKAFCRSLGMPVEETAKQSVHRAEGDVLESIAHAKQCAGWLQEWRGQ